MSIAGYISAHWRGYTGAPCGICVRPPASSNLMAFISLLACLLLQNLQRPRRPRQGQNSLPVMFLFKAVRPSLSPLKALAVLLLVALVPTSRALAATKLPRLSVVATKLPRPPAMDLKMAVDLVGAISSESSDNNSAVDEEIFRTPQSTQVIEEDSDEIASVPPSLDEQQQDEHEDEEDLVEELRFKMKFNLGSGFALYKEPGEHPEWVTKPEFKKAEKYIILPYLSDFFEE